MILRRNFFILQILTIHQVLFGIIRFYLLNFLSNSKKYIRLGQNKDLELYLRLRSDIKSAMKDKDQLKLNVVKVNMAWNL